MTEIELLIDFHKDNKRQGPGSTEDTLKAFNFIDIDDSRPIQVADIGCGTGAQTLVLAQNLNAHITAVDLSPELLEKLNANVTELGLQDKVSTLQESMDNLPFQKEEFDLIWSEGAIYILGFEEGIKKWKHFLNKGGYLAVSEITWITDTRPKEIEEHWMKEYPQVASASTKIRLLEENGFSPVGYFYLSEASWIKNYYEPIEERMDSFLQKHNFSDLAKAIVESEKEEISLYRKYKDYLSYGFYIAKKVV